MDETFRIIEINELKGCPFCGHNPSSTVCEPHKHSIAKFMPDKEDYTIFIECSSCPCCMSITGVDLQDAIENSIEIWNKRF